MSSLVGICYGPNSSILFTDSHARTIYSLTAEKKNLRILNDTLKLEQPTGIAYSMVNKEIWVVETKAHRIAVLNEKGELLRRLGKRGNGPGEFNYPTHIWIDKKGLIYITDAMNFRIQVLNAGGEVVSIFGEAGDASGYLASPKGIATDSFGNIYVVDALFHVVQVFDIKGKLLYKFGNQGHGNGEFWMPSGIYIDNQDNIYVADSYNSRVQVFQLIFTDIK
jgi:DNA-binding beta-propeller fold protein YncE